MKGIVTVWGFMALLLLFAAPAAAAPFVPVDDALVLERLPSRGMVEHRELQDLRDKALAEPANADAAVALANAYYQISRREGDPRYLGYAQAALNRWWKDADAPAAVLVMRATLMQSAHDFERALVDLDRAIAKEPDHAQALLVRATVLTVRGEYSRALADCGQLRGRIGDVYVVICLASVEALTGNTKQAKSALNFARDNLAAGDAAALAWIESLLGEIAQRLGEASAEAHFKAALAADPRDLYTITAYCDWLLDRQRPADVIPLAESGWQVDGLLLRLALAHHALRLPEAQTSVELLRARIAASRARGDTVNRREDARFYLALDGDSQTALQLARDNWAVQREPADLRILAEAARATGDTAALDTVRQWLKTTRLEYPAVAELVK